MATPLSLCVSVGQDTIKEMHFPNKFENWGKKNTLKMYKYECMHTIAVILTRIKMYFNTVPDRLIRDIKDIITNVSNYEMN